MWSFDSARSQDARRAGRCGAAPRKHLLPDLRLPIPSHPRDHVPHPTEHDPFAGRAHQPGSYRQKKVPHDRRHHRQKQVLKHRSASRERNRRDIEGIARLIQIFNSSIVIDDTVSEHHSGAASPASVASPWVESSRESMNECIDASKTCSRCKGERTVRLTAGVPGRRMLCKTCAIKLGKRSRKKDDGPGDAKLASKRG